MPARGSSPLVPIKKTAPRVTTRARMGVARRQLAAPGCRQGWFRRWQRAAARRAQWRWQAATHAASREKTSRTWKTPKKMRARAPRVPRNGSWRLLRAGNGRPWRAPRLGKGLRRTRSAVLRTSGAAPAWPPAAPRDSTSATSMLLSSGQYEQVPFWGCWPLPSGSAGSPGSGARQSRADAAASRGMVIAAWPDIAMACGMP